jgi:hypothetical protein
MKTRNEFDLMEEVTDTDGGAPGIVEAQEPVIDPTLSDRLSQPDGTFTDDYQEKPDVAADGGQGAFKPSRYWDMVADVQDFTMPTDITKDNEIELLKPYVAKKFGLDQPVIQPATDIHPYAMKVQEIIEQNPNATLSDIAQQLGSEIIDIDHMSPAELIRMDIINTYGMKDETTNPEGFTDEDIEEHLSTMTKLQRTQSSDLIKQKYKTINEQKQNEYTTQINERNEKVYNEYMENLDNVHTKLVAEFNNTSDIYGIKLGQPEIKVYIDEFKEFLLPDKTTGIRKLDTWLSNDQTMFKLFVIASKLGENRVREIITQGREQAKLDILNKFGLTVPKEGKQGERINKMDPMELNERLSSPDGTFN